MRKQTGFGLALSLALLAGIQTAALAQDQNATADRTTTSTSTPDAPKRGGSTGRDLSISAAKSANHTTLFRALRVSGLTDQAAEKGPYTVFAPTNAAFDQLEPGTLDGLLQPANKKKLVSLLSYHVVKGKLTADQLQDGQKLRTVTGGTLVVGKQGDSITITDGQGSTANVTMADIEATNGVIHSVDTVLMPAAKK